MGRALAVGRRALATADVPVGALVLDENGEVLGEGHNAREATGDATAHAELVALRRASLARGAWRLDGCTLVVTLEPCTMCAGAIVLARVTRLVFGAWDEKAGAAGSVRDVVRDSRLNHQVEVYGGVRQRDCAEALRGFFEERRRDGGGDGGPPPAGGIQ